jgi:hypothetical protein
MICQGPAIQGKVSLTCDAWQASNTDGYFAVMVHWIQEPIARKWELKSALISFTGLNNAHNGEWLGQALFKVVKWVGIEHKVCVSSHTYLPYLSCCKGWPCHLRQCQQQFNHVEGICHMTSGHYRQGVQMEE